MIVRSFAVASRLAACFAALAACACSGGEREGYVLIDEAPRNVLQVDLDVGAVLAAEDPGKGVQLLVESPSAGKWRVVSTCDSLSSGYACDWDVVVAVAEGSSMEDTTEEAISY